MKNHHNYSQLDSDKSFILVVITVKDVSGDVTSILFKKIASLQRICYQTLYSTTFYIS